MISVGIIDTVGFVGSVNALDTCLKTADVEFVRFEKMSGGIVSIVIKGDVGAVTSSVAAGVEAAKAVGEYFNHTIIARLDQHTRELLNKKVPGTTQAAPAAEVELTEEITATERPDEKADHREEPDCQENLTQQLASDEEQSAADSEEIELMAVPDGRDHIFTEDVLNNMTVSNLRKLAREMALKGLSREQIKRVRKVDLIASILIELPEEEG